MVDTPDLIKCSLKHILSVSFFRNFIVMKKRWFIKERIDEETFKKVCESSSSMAEAAYKLGLHFNSFKKRAIELNCYKPNQAGKGILKKMPKIPLKAIIFEGKHPSYQTFKLKRRLLREGFKENQCEKCGISDWNKKTLNMELHHIDGNRNNHLFSNLILLCPNCHSQTATFRSKNRKN